VNETRMFEKSNTAPRGANKNKTVEQRKKSMDQVLYVYNRVSTKENMRRRVGKATLYRSPEELSGSNKKKACLSREASRNLHQFYAAAKETSTGPVLGTVHMGRVEDPSARNRTRPTSKPDERRAQEKRNDSSTARQQTRSRTRAGGNSRSHAAFQYAEAGDAQTRVFRTPKMEGGGGAAVKSRRKSFFSDLLDSFDESWLGEVELLKKQAILHKKFVEHRRGMALALAILMLFALCSTGIYKLLFQVRTVEIQGSAMYSGQQILTASGLGEKACMYDFRAQDIEDRITFHYPMIRSVALNRNLPDTLVLTLEEDSAQYCANIFGEIVALSDGLRVLGTLTEEEAEQYILLRLPAVKEAVAGRTIVFAEGQNERYIRSTLTETVASQLADRISYIDLREENNIVMYCDGMYSLEFGNTTDLKMKLRRAQAAIEDPDFPQNTLARINLSVVGEASVRADLRLDLTVEP